MSWRLTTICVLCYLLCFRLVVDQGGLEHLMECLAHAKMSIQASAASCLSNLATDGLEETCCGDLVR